MLSKITMFNAKNAGVAIEEGMKIKVAGVGTFADKDKDGHDVTVSVLEAVDGTPYTTISGTVAKSIDMLADIIEEQGAVEVEVQKNTSNNGREFYQLRIIG